MPKKKVTEEPLQSRADDVDTVLSRIAEFNKLTQGMKSGAVSIKTNPDDIYFIDLKKADSDNITWKRFHGKCFKAGFKEYEKSGYAYTITSHVEKSDKTKSRTTCEHCEEAINPVLAAERHAEWLERQAKRKSDYDRKLRIQKAREDELVLLGKL